MIQSVGLPETTLNEYTFVPANNPANTRHGGVGLFPANTRHGGVGLFPANTRHGVCVCVWGGGGGGVISTNIHFPL